MRWGGRRWIIPALIWMAIINGFVALIAFAAKSDPAMAGQDIASQAVDVFVQIGIFAAAIGVVIGAQGAIIRGETTGDSRLDTVQACLPQRVHSVQVGCLFHFHGGPVAGPDCHCFPD